MKFIKAKNKSQKLNNKYEEGFALVLTLWVLAIISILLLTFALSVDLSVKNASYLKDDIVSKGLTIGAINRLKITLVYPKDRNKAAKSDDSGKSDKDSSKDKDSNNSNSNNSNKSDNSSNSNNNSDNSKADSDKKVDPKTKEENKKKADWYFKVLGKWYVYTDDWRVTREKELHSDSADYIICEVTAEDAKFDLKKINDIDKLTGYSDDILENIKEKLKNEKDFSITCVPQLLMINGVEGESYDGDGQGLKGLKNVMTTFSDGKIYINKATAEALSFVPGMDPGAAQTIAQYDDLISDVDQLKELIGTADENTKKKLEDWLKFVPEYFKIKAYRSVNGIDEVSEAVISIKDGQIELLSLK